MCTGAATVLQVGGGRRAASQPANTPRIDSPRSLKGNPGGLCGSVRFVASGCIQTVNPPSSFPHHTHVIPTPPASFPHPPTSFPRRRESPPHTTTLSRPARPSPNAPSPATTSFWTRPIYDPQKVQRPSATASTPMTAPSRPQILPPMAAAVIIPKSMNSANRSDPI